MARKLRFRLPPVPCSVVETVLGSFYGNRTKKVVNQDTFQTHRWKPQRGSLQPSGEDSARSLRSRALLALQLVELQFVNVAKEFFYLLVTGYQF